MTLGQSINQVALCFFFFINALRFVKRSRHSLTSGTFKCISRTSLFLGNFCLLETGHSLPRGTLAPRRSRVMGIIKTSYAKTMQSVTCSTPLEEDQRQKAFSRSPARQHKQS
ncbi:hypothetical protein FOQG_06363 [Fusarium oxysporum f. sp. raphani 54005]|uniref:Uncharacterized protein n=2 Tax=Fusarium oxysporum TaxID=5507 RepID=X0CK73_FUSOX|nr:hypothetical protein FOVG_08452 [Fusarium oxysporum f. sp. pisi HDV247]EXK91668.1 hypothetical protein FOQG_06363 [Fusarium oxysporum f. sp. raphani 54005]